MNLLRQSLYIIVRLENMIININKNDGWQNMICNNIIILMNILNHNLKKWLKPI